MQQLQRDVGRVEAKVEIMSDDLKTIKTDLAAIKLALSDQKAVSVSDYKRLGLVALLSSIATTIFGWVKPLIT